MKVSSRAYSKLETTDADSKLENAVAEAFLKQLDSLDTKLVTMETSYDGLIATDPINAKGYCTVKANKLKDATMKRTRLRTGVLGLQMPISSVGARRSGAGAAPTAPTIGAFNFYEKKPFPKFSGSKREYLGFCRKWIEVVVMRYLGQEHFLVREIAPHIPAEVEPHIKNLKTMAKV